MTDRSYTVAEIEWMRQAIEHEYLYGEKISQRNFGEGTGVMSRSFDAAEKTVHVEELLRTYLLAGVEPKDLQ